MISGKLLWTIHIDIGSVVTSSEVGTCNYTMHKQTLQTSLDNYVLLKFPDFLSVVIKCLLSY